MGDDGEQSSPSTPQGLFAMTRGVCVLLVALCASLAAADVAAQEANAADGPAPPASAPAAASAPQAAAPAASAASVAADAAPAPAAPASSGHPEPLAFKDWKWEGAVGPVVNVAPDYAGASTRKV